MSFITPQFMLRNKTAARLYESYAKDMPIIDYHCHISPQEIYEDRRFDSITQLWLGGDHYKWRLIRSDGVPEEEITGEADPRLKFKRFAAALPKAIGNPMYHWCHLELKRYFGYDGILNADTADLVYDLANKRLAEPDMSARGIISRSNVRMIGTTDDPADDLKWHRLLAGDSSFKTMVCPSFRPDKAINIDKPGFLEYIGLLQESAGVKIRSIQELFQALDARLDYFVENGCLATDHGLDYMVYAPSTVEQTDRIFKKALNSQPLTAEECEMYKTAVLLHLGREYAKRNIVMQIHYGVQRNANKKMLRALGPDTGFDCISTVECSSAVAGFLDALDCEGLLPKTILYSLNSADNAMLDTVIGSFQGSIVPGKIQHGAAWWFHDTAFGMEAHLRSLASLSILGNFIGMLTDSRSLLSYTRHEYFRRLLCSIIGQWVEDGEYPCDEAALESIIKGISYENAARYFGVRQL